MCWYFHRQNGKAYKGGTYKGLDITIGEIGSPSIVDTTTTTTTTSTTKRQTSRGGGAGGLLIRSIMNIATGEIIQGPCRVMNELLTITPSNMTTVQDLVTDLQNASLSNQLPITISSQDLLTLTRIKSNGQMIFKSPRVGLTFRRVSPLQGREYLMAPYRFTYSKVDYKANKSLLTILEMNLNQFQMKKLSNGMRQRTSLGASLGVGVGMSKPPSKGAQEWMKSYREGVCHRAEDDEKDRLLMGERGGGERRWDWFKKRMARYAGVEWKVSELCYLYGYLIDTNNLQEMIDFDVERDLSEE
jgi:hypothetical protein